MSAAVEAKVISTIKEWTQDFIKIRSAKIAACSEAIERDNSAKGATGTGMTGSCYKATGLKCCTAPRAMKAPIIGREYTWTKSGYNGYPIPGSHQWEDTPTRCTLDNPLVQMFYSNIGPMQTSQSGRITMPGAGKYLVYQNAEVAHLKRYVTSALETSFPGEQLTTNIASADKGNHFAVVIGAGQRNSVSRRLLGGGPVQNNTELDGKQPGWYECEVKYLALISIAPAQPRCLKNARGADLCEPKMSASLHLWMESQTVIDAEHKVRRRRRSKPIVLPNGTTIIPDYSKMFSLGAQSVSWGKLMRPKNNAATCAKVDTALRLALTEYRFELSVSARMKMYQRVVPAARVEKQAHLVQ